MFYEITDKTWYFLFKNNFSKKGLGNLAELEGTMMLLYVF